MLREKRADIAQEQEKARVTSRPLSSEEVEEMILGTRPVPRANGLRKMSA